MDKVDYRIKDFGKLIKKNALDNRRELGSQDTNCMRVYDRNMEEIPVTVDVYGNYARITDYGEEPLSEELISRLKDSCASFLYKEPDKVVYQRRNKREGLEQHILNAEPTPVRVTESGLSFNCDLTKHIDTGLFLDNVLTRRYIRDISDGRDVLNLFCYTGAYSVYAAAGGAKSVTSVDLSSGYLEQARKNMEENLFSGPQFKYVNNDVIDFITHPGEERYDIVIFDGPAFSNSNKLEKDYRLDRDWKRCLDALYLLTRENGIVLFQSNLSSFRLDTGPDDGWKVTEITRKVTAPGFTQKTGRSRSWILEKRERTFTKRDSGKTGKMSHTGYRNGEKHFSSSDRPRYGKSGYGRDSRRDDGYREREDSFRSRDSYESRDNYKSHDNGYRDYRDSRPSYRDRDSFSEKKSYSDRRSYSDRPDRFRSERDSYSRDGGRSFDRPRHDTHERYHNERRSRTEYSDRNERSERPSYRDRDSKFSSDSGDRGDKPFRKPKSKGPKPYGFDKFTETKDRSGSDDDGTFFWLDEN